MNQYGLITYKNGKMVLTPDGQGGVFQRIVVFGTSYVRHTFTDSDGMGIFGLPIFGGLHTLVYGIDGSGYPYIEAQGYQKPSWASGQSDSQWETRVAIFSR